MLAIIGNGIVGHPSGSKFTIMKRKQKKSDAYMALLQRTQQLPRSALKAKLPQESRR
jgi:hypothetical protein